MKSLFVIIVSILFFGCQKIEFASYPYPRLNGRWDVVKIKVVIDKVNYNSNVKVVNESKATVSTFLVAGLTQNNELLLTQDYKATDIKHRFDIDSTHWEFDNRTLVIKDGSGQEIVESDFPCVYCNEYTILYLNRSFLNPARYTFTTDTYGSMPANVLTLTSETFYTNIYANGNRFDKAIVAHLEITLHKF